MILRYATESIPRGGLMLEKPGEAKEVHLVPLVQLDADAQAKVREIRNEEGIRKWMYTDHVISPEEHGNWIRNLKTDERQIVFVVLEKELGIAGVISVNAIDRKHKKSDWAYYLTQNARGGLGSALEFAFLNFIFDTLGIEKLNCEMIEGNDPVVKLHKKFLFQEEGFRRSNVVKNGARIGAHFMGLTKEEWSAGKVQVYETYRKVLDKFSISIQWDKGPIT
jgi:UDP-4-amino-4,6-dideoxy-N-acetyl-beta-L-altrosamine N-acetyltransferase